MTRSELNTKAWRQQDIWGEKVSNILTYAFAGGLAVGTVVVEVFANGVGERLFGAGLGVGSGLMARHGAAEHEDIQQMQAELPGQ